MNKQILRIILINLAILLVLVIGINIYKKDSANLKYNPPYGTDITQNKIKLNNIESVSLDKEKQTIITNSINNYFIKHGNNTNYSFNVNKDSVYQTIPNENNIQTITFNINSLNNSEEYSVIIDISGNNWIRTTVQQAGTNNILTTFKTF